MGNISSSEGLEGEGEREREREPYPTIHERTHHYSDRFRLIARVLSTFIQCQMPLDNAHSVILRVSPNAPGHIKDPNRYQQQTTLVTPSKQADQALAGLEGLLSNKNYLDKRDFITYSLEFVSDMRHSLFNILELFIYLVCGLYPTERSLDLLRVLRT